MANHANSTDPKSKDLWDKVNILFSALTPIAIFVAGIYISSATRSLEEKRTEERDRHDAQIAESQLRISGTDLAVKLLEPLASNDAKKRNMAREIMLSAVIPDGPRILKAIAEVPLATSAITEKETVDALDVKRQELVKLFFSQDRGDRVRTYRNIQSQWQDDSKLFGALLTEADRRWNDPNSILTTTSVALRFSDAVLTDHNKEIEGFLAKIPNNDNWRETLGYAKRVKERLNQMSPNA
jgi:hypothetical protein